MLELFKKDKLFYSVLGVLILILIGIGILSPIKEKSVFNNWNEEVDLRIEKIVNDAENVYGAIENDLILTKNKLLDKFSSGEEFGITYSNLHPDIRKVNQNELSIVIQNENGVYEFWTNEPLFQKSDLKTLDNEFNEVHFVSNELITYLSVTDTFNIAGEKKFLTVSVPIEKKYFINNKSFKNISLKNELSLRFNTAFKIDYSPLAQHSLDGRQYSFDLLNNFHNKIGVISFYKPFRDSELNKLREEYGLWQSIILVLIFIVIGLYIFRKVKTFKSGLLILGSIFTYLILFRYVLFYLNLPAALINSSLNDAKYFSSTFAFGIVSTPLELFITLLFASVPVIYLFLLSKNIYRSKNYNANYYKLIFSTFLLCLLFLLLLRGFGASIRSVIFDSSFYYFTDSSLIPKSPEAFMHLNVLLLGFLVIILSLVIILVNFTLMKPKRNINLFISLYLFYQFFGMVFDYFQEWPQGTPLIRILFITIIFIIFFFLFRNNNFSRIHYFTFGVIAAIFTSMLLNFYNYELERESLKSYARELSKPKTEIVKNVIEETLSKVSVSEDVKNDFINQSGYAPSAFKIWTKSNIANLSLASSVEFLDENKNLLDGFSINSHDRLFYKWDNYKKPLMELKIISAIDPFNGNDYTYGICPVYFSNELLGYISVSVENGVENIHNRLDFQFLKNSTSRIFKTLDLKKIKLFELFNGEQPETFAEFRLSLQELKEIEEANFNKFNEAWLNIKLKGEDHLVYAMSFKNEYVDRIFAAGMPLKEFSFSLFDFFKAFFIQLLYIICLFSIVIVIEFGRKKIVVRTMRYKLLGGFLVVSLVPLILMAIYFRGLTEEKNQDAIKYKLGKRAASVVEYINKYNKQSSLNLSAICEKAAFDLGINFTLYERNFSVYNTFSNVEKAQIISKRINFFAINHLVKNEKSEIVLNEKIENYPYFSYYKEVKIGGKFYIINVADIFNPISLPMSETELDIFLIGSYSLAVLLIIIVSTIFSNQISYPIRKITKATKSVAAGDLSIKLDEKYKGEMGELVNGFNKMLKDLKKDQIKIAEMERESAWKEMARQVAHEIKNPLTPMKLSLQQLIASKNENHPQFSKMFDDISKMIIGQIEILKNIASEFSSFARMPGVKLEKADLIKEIQESIDLFREEKINLNLNFDESSVFVKIDKEQIKRIITNLIRNSIQAESENIWISIEKQFHFYLISIKDDGKGIPSEIKSRIFEKNFTTKPEGMGLGLNMAKKFIELIGGKIELKETSENGTTLLIKIPEAVDG